MVIDMGGEHIGVSYGKIKRTPGQLDCERARESSKACNHKPCA